MDLIEPDWREIVKDLGPGLYRYFCGVFPEAQASELAQDCLVRLVQKHRAGAFDPARGSIKSFAFGIARFVRLEAKKSTRDFESLDDVQEEPADQDGTENAEVIHLRWAIRQLKPTEQEIILLLIDAEFSLDQISSALNMPVGTVKSYIHRTKEKLRQIMEIKNGSC